MRRSLAELPLAAAPLLEQRFYHRRQGQMGTIQIDRFASLTIQRVSHNSRMNYVACTNSKTRLGYALSPK
jgi:hypothetical protein